MKNTNKELKEIASVLLDSNAHMGALFQATQAYKKLLLGATHVNFEEMGAEENIYTESGKAIGAKWASLCVDDVMRTHKFCLGLYNAVKRKKQQHPTKKIHVLYAGTGPFATLILPLTTVFDSSEISFTLLEINPLTLKALEETLSYFGLETYINAVVQCDATTYQIPETGDVDIVVIETMMHGLKGEHQVPISFNMVAQLPKEVTLIPQEINLNLLAVHSERRGANKVSLGQPIAYFEKLTNLFSLTKETIGAYQTPFFDSFPNYSFPEVTTEISKSTIQNFNELYVETHIRVFEDEVIGIDESGLTALLKIHEFKTLMLPSKYLVSTYLCGQNPGLHFSFEN